MLVGKYIFTPALFNKLIHLFASSVKILVAYWKQNQTHQHQNSQQQQKSQKPNCAFPRSGEASVLCQEMSLCFQKLIKRLKVVLKGVIK